MLSPQAPLIFSYLYQNYAELQSFPQHLSKLKAGSGKCSAATQWLLLVLPISSYQVKKKKNQVKLQVALRAEALCIPVVPGLLWNMGHCCLSSPVCKWILLFLSFCQQKQNFIWSPSHKTIIVLQQLIFTGLQCSFLYTADNASKPLTQLLHCRVDQSIDFAVLYHCQTHQFPSLFPLRDCSVPFLGLFTKHNLF